MSKLYSCIFICLAVSLNIPAQGMCGRFSSYMANKFSSSIAAVNRFSVRSPLSMSYFKNKFTQVRAPIVRNRVNLFSALYGGGMFASLGAWFAVTKNKQEKEQRLEPKIVTPNESVSPLVNLPQEDAYKAPWIEERKKHYQELHAKPWSDVSKKYFEILKRRENELQTELLFRFNLTPQSWQQFKQDSHQEFLMQTHQEIDSIATQTAGQALDARIIAAVEKASVHIGVDSDKIKVILAPSNTPSTMFVTQNHLVINQTLCLIPYFSDDQKREVSVAREMQHLLHDDSYDKYCIEKLYKIHSDKVTQEAYEEFAKKVSHFKEERADILVSLANRQYGQTGKDTFKDLSNPSWFLQKITQSLGKDLKDPSPMTHPTSLYRYECINAVHSEMIKTMQ